MPRRTPDLCIRVADGLSALAVDYHAAGLIHPLRAALPELAIGPVALIRQGRVAVGDEVAQAMGAPLCLMLIGERPGLSVADSLGAYLSWNPEVGMPDSLRNCVSNIHDRGGLSQAAAVDLLSWLIRRAGGIGAPGVALKDDRVTVPQIG